MATADCSMTDHLQHDSVIICDAILVPGYLDKLKVSGIKWVSGFPGNITNRLPTIVGVLILNDCETGMYVD